MMSKGDRLCSLKVGIAGHNGLAVCPSLSEKSRGESSEQLDYVASFVTHIEAKVECDLVVS